MRKTRLTLLAAALVAVLAFPAASNAQLQNQTVSGLVTATNLSLVLGAAPAQMTLAPNSVGNANGTVVVTSTQPWYLFAKGSATGTAGKMDLLQVPGVCDATTSTTELAQALQVGTSGAATAPGTLVHQAAAPLTGAYQNLANGSLIQTVATNYSQTVGAELLKGGCTFQETVTWGVSPDNNPTNIVQ